MSLHNDNRYATAEAWALPRPVHREHGKVQVNVELYVFGALVVIWLADNTIDLFIVDCLGDAWKYRRRIRAHDDEGESF